MGQPPQHQEQQLSLTLTTISGKTAVHSFNSKELVHAVIAKGRELLALPPNPPREYVAYLEQGEGKQRELNPRLSLAAEHVPNGATILIVSPQNKDG